MRFAIERRYMQLRGAGWHADAALRQARLTFAWDRREAGEHDEPDAMHCVRLRIESDDGIDFEDLCGECFDPRANPDIPRARLEREREVFRAKCQRDGVWYVVGEFWDEVNGRWDHADSCGGFVGDDAHDPAAVGDLMASALAARLQSVRAWRAMCRAAP